MSQPIISVEGIGKHYFLSHKKRQDTLRDSIAQSVRSFFQRDAQSAAAAHEEFWALRDVSFQVNPGDVVGIIGRNGAGKSTLLKTLSRITEPTKGRAVIRGRVASLLEVGTGFHPELSGRENIFLNGAILGMSRAEITRKFDEIVAFAEVERFLDTQVKHYSSGMYVRLAFAVAAHLEPEILIVDEVLAVGDAAFQRKCLGKMHAVSRNEGRTVLLVSHNLSQIAMLANTCVLLEKGQIKFAGKTTEAISHYFGHESAGQTEQIFAKPADQPHLHRVSLTTSEPGNVQAYGRPMLLEFELHHPEPVPDACFSFQIINSSGQAVVHLWRYSTDGAFATTAGVTRLRCEIPFVHLNIGLHSLRAFFSGPPGSLFSEMSEPTLTFEMVRLDRTVLFGWRSEACTYFEDATWVLNPPPSP
jgi:ABC-type polysaccharide/polyol phosphate transport system ATPase subunit